LVQPAQPLRILQIQEAGKEWFAMLAGAQLDLFTPLDNGPMRADALAAALDVDADKLSLLLYALVVAGLLTVEDGRFANTAETAQFFVRGKPTYMGSTHTFWAESSAAGLKTAESVRTGIPQAEHNYRAMSEDELLSTLGGLHASGVDRGRALAARYDFSSARTVLDVAGGSGGMSIGLIEACPNLHATIAELPNVVPIAERFIGEAGVGNRIDTIAVDLLRQAVPGQYDMAIVSYVIQVLSATNAQIALRNAAHALRPGGAIYLINQILDASRLTPARAARTNVLFLTWYDGGQAYTEAECRAMLAAAGFEEITREEDLTGLGLIRARKAG
jgi:predicted O-methyltransferase YrrM